MSDRRNRYPLVLLSLYVLWWSALAIAPWYRQDWLLENLLVFIAVPLLVRAQQRIPLSNAACTGLFLFFSLHALGAYYTYSQVPYDEWAISLSGHSISELLGTERNHFDRLVHFLYGLLITPTAIEVLDARAPQRGIWRWLLPWLFMVSHGTLYEIIEAAAAVAFGGDLGQAYLGDQGDIWDAQKDMAWAALGAALSVLWCRGPQAVRRLS
jgi:putative membrane protein